MNQQRTWQEIIFLAAPVVISKLSFTIMGLVDIAMVGKLGATEQGGVGIATTFLITIYVLGLGMITVVNSFVSQYRGAQKPDLCGQVLNNALFLAVIIGFFNMAFLIASEPLFLLSGLSEGVSKASYDYIFFRALGTPAVFIYFSYNSYIEGVGKTQITMKISLIANIVNIIGDYIFIFGWGIIPPMGVKGAAIATALSNTFILLCLMWTVHKPGSYFKEFGNRYIFKPLQWTMIKKLITVGSPVGMQYFMQHSAVLLCNIFVGQVGDIDLAASQVTMRIMSISFMTAWGISIATTTLVGKYQGMGNQRKAYYIGLHANALALIFTVFCSTLFMLIPEVFVQVFSSSKKIIKLASILLRIAAFFQIFDSISLVSSGALKGAGDTMWPFKTNSAINWFIGVPLVYIFTIKAELGGHWNVAWNACHDNISGNSYVFKIQTWTLEKD